MAEVRVAMDREPGPCTYLLALVDELALPGLVMWLSASPLMAEYGILKPDSRVQLCAGYAHLNTYSNKVVDIQMSICKEN